MTRISSAYHLDQVHRGFELWVFLGRVMLIAKNQRVMGHLPSQRMDKVQGLGQTDSRELDR